MCSDDFLRYEGKPPRELPDGDLRGLHALYRLYHTAQGWVFLACPSQGDFEKFCRAAGHHELAIDSRFSDDVSRRYHDASLTESLTHVFAERTAKQWERDLTRTGVACVSAGEGGQDDFFLLDPAVKDNGFVVQRHRGETGTMWRHGPAVQFSRTPARDELAHAFGGDTNSILEELGYSQEEIRALRATAVA